MATFGEIRFFLTKRFPGVDPDLLDGYINDRYKDIIDWTDWKPLELSGTLQTVAPISDGTVAVIKGSTTVTGTSTGWTSAITGRGFRPAARSEIYTATFVSATQLTLDRGYEGDTATALAYRIFQNIYSLGATVRLLDSLRDPNAQRDLDQKTREELDEISPSRARVDAPEFYVLIELDGSNNTQVELYPIPIDARGLPFRGTKTVAALSADTDTILPWVSVRAIKLGAEADLLALREDLAGAGAKEAGYQEAIQKMIREEAPRIGVTKIQPASRFTRHYRQRGRR